MQLILVNGDTFRNRKLSVYVHVCPRIVSFKFWSLTLTVLFLLFDLACLTETCSFECGLNDLFLLLKEAVKAVYGRQNRS